jgi:hypothetical protein
VGVLLLAGLLLLLLVAGSSLGFIIIPLWIVCHALSIARRGKPSQLLPKLEFQRDPDARRLSGLVF